MGRGLQVVVGALLGCCLALAGCDRSPFAPGDGDAVERAAAPRPGHGAARRLLAITEEYYDAYLALNPLAATAQGDHRFDDRFGDYVSQRWMADSLAIEQEALRKLATVDPEKLSGEDRLSYESFRHGREVGIAGFRYPSELLPVQHFSGLHLEFALLGSGRGLHPFRTTTDYDNFLARMDGFVRWVDHCISGLRTGVAKGVVQPKVVVERMIPQLAALAGAEPRESVFWQPILYFPAGITVADRRRLIAAYDDKLRDDVLPAYRRLHDYLENEYLAQARESIAWSDLPNGAAWYAYLVRYYTRTSLTPDEVHEMGLREVERLRKEMQRVARQLGHEGELRAFLDRLRADPEQHYEEPEELLAGYRALRSRVDAAMPLLFEHRAAAGFEIRVVEPFRATSAASASYVPGSPDGVRPGVFYVNTHDLASRPRYAMEALYLHEAVPGHQYQETIAQASAGLPRFRRFGRDPSYGEGWAAYAESLGRDLGLYVDPYSAFGALAADSWRAVRLVVDTGLHARGWSRAQAIAYFRDNTALGESDIGAEVDRYIAWPAQALAYKIGQMRIAELRRRAERALGPRFDVRAFHAKVLESGSLPLPVLEAKIDRWIAAR